MRSGLVKGKTLWKYQSTWSGKARLDESVHGDFERSIWPALPPADICDRVSQPCVSFPQVFAFCMRREATGRTSATSAEAGTAAGQFESTATVTGRSGG